jgi:hypothetical protein
VYGTGRIDASGRVADRAVIEALAGIVGLVVIGRPLDGHRVVPGRRCLVVAQAGAGYGVVEDLHDLGAQGAYELAVPAGGVLPGDPSLLVRGGSQGQVGLAEEPVVGDDAVPGGEDVRQAGAHHPVDVNRAAGAEAGPGGSCQSGLRPHSHYDQDHVRAPCLRLSVGRDGLDPQPSGGAGRGAADGLDRGAS